MAHGASISHPVAQHQPPVRRQTRDPLREQGADVVHGVVVVEMVEVDVEHDRDVGRQLRDGAVRLVALGDAQVAGAARGVRAELGHVAADEVRGLQAEVAGRHRQHGARRRLAVGARHHEPPAMVGEDRGEGVGAVLDGEPLRAGGGELGLVRVDGRRDDEAVDAREVRGVVRRGAGDAGRPQRVEGRRLGTVAAADVHARRREHARDPAHADAADADEVRAHAASSSTASAASRAASGRASPRIAVAMAPSRAGSPSRASTS